MLHGPAHGLTASIRLSRSPIATASRRLVPATGAGM